MCSKDGLFQKFEVSDKEFQGHMHEFLRKTDQYYKNVPQHPKGEDTNNDTIV